MSYPPAPQQPYSPGPPATDPGQTLSIVGIVLAIFCGLGGIICGIIGRNKSRQAGYSGQLGTAAIVVGAVVIVLGMLYAGLSI